MQGVLSVTSLLRWRGIQTIASGSRLYLFHHRRSFKPWRSSPKMIAGSPAIIWSWLFSFILPGADNPPRTFTVNGQDMSFVLRHWYAESNWILLHHNLVSLRPFKNSFFLEILVLSFKGGMIKKEQLVCIEMKLWWTNSSSPLKYYNLLDKRWELCGFCSYIVWKYLEQG